jgi:hypothetical protein
MGDTITNGYRAYMLRLRRTDGAQPAWRASLDEVATGERYVFATLDEMLAWLREETGEGNSAPYADTQRMNPEGGEGHAPKLGELGDH